jgi:hypothetical protein
LGIFLSPNSVSVLQSGSNSGFAPPHKMFFLDNGYIQCPCLHCFSPSGFSACIHNMKALQNSYSTRGSSDFRRRSEACEESFGCFQEIHYHRIGQSESKICISNMHGL